MKARVCELCGAPALFRTRGIYGGWGSAIRMAFLRWHSLCINHDAETVLRVSLGRRARYQLTVEEDQSP